MSEPSDDERMRVGAALHFGLNAADRHDKAVYLGLYRLYLELLED